MVLAVIAVIALIIVLSAFLFAYKVLCLFVSQETGQTEDEEVEFVQVSNGFPIGFSRPEEEDDDD